MRYDRLSNDNSRDAAAEISQLDNSIETLSSVHDRRGRGWRNMVAQWFRGAPGSQGGPTQPEEPEDKKSDGQPGES